MGQAGVLPARDPNGVKNGLWLANWPALILATRRRGATHKNASVFAGSDFWGILLASEWGGEVGLKLWVMLECSPR